MNHYCNVVCFSDVGLQPGNGIPFPGGENLLPISTTKVLVTEGSLHPISLKKTEVTIYSIKSKYSYVRMIFFF